MDNTPIIKSGTYKHTKSGKLYEVLGVAFQTETEEWLVIYRPLYEINIQFFARPYGMFIEPVMLGGVSMPRFVKIDSE